MLLPGQTSLLLLELGVKEAADAQQQLFTGCTLSPVLLWKSALCSPALIQSLCYEAVGVRGLLLPTGEEEPAELKLFSASAAF